MLINCKSCEKKFVVPDSAITESRRLVQCSSCGNKWTQYPVKSVKIEKLQSIRKKTTKTKPRPKKNLYTIEYLQKKHGLVIGEASNKPDSETASTTKRQSGFGFYGYIAFLIVFLASLFGVLNLTKEIIILKYPSTEIYISYLYEVIEIIKNSFLSL